MTQIDEIIAALRKENIRTWFDLGLFLDRFKEKNECGIPLFEGSYEEFLKSVAGGGIAFVTFFYSVDGVSMEIQKYSKALERIFGRPKFHYICGKLHENGKFLVPPNATCVQFEELKSFDEWSLYHDFFFQKLERGSDSYNELILKFWEEVLDLTAKLGKYITDNDIRLLFLVNTNSNPGNVSLALAMVFLSEFLKIPVICNNHDFYWDGGHSEIERETRGLAPGPRDHFFRNFHLGEVFSLLETIYPWESRFWISVNINAPQSAALIEDHGHNPANVMEIGTAIDFDKFHKIDDAQKKQQILGQVAQIFADEAGQVMVTAVDKFLQRKTRSEHEIKPTLFGAETATRPDFLHENDILLQPTRVIQRKAIEVNFALIRRLLEDTEFATRFGERKNAKLTILVTGPIATGHYSYFLKILQEFQSFTGSIEPSFARRIYLGFLFSEFERPGFRRKQEQPFSVGDLFNIASAVLLPSETEGRGLPILEAATCEVPMFCRRYEPEAVYADVVGEHLPEDERIRNFEFRDLAFEPGVIDALKRAILEPDTLKKILQQNRQNVESRFSLAAMEQEFGQIIYKLYLQLSAGAEPVINARTALKDYKIHLRLNRGFAQRIMHTEKRQYLAGYGQMAFMLFLKSLIDPSYFRVEEKRIRGMAMRFARELVENAPEPSELGEEMIHAFYNAVDALFRYHTGEIPIRLDHSLAYRHRNKLYYPYRDFTPQELTGVINLLFKKLIAPPPVLTEIAGEKPGPVWRDNLDALLDGAPLAIDHVGELERKLVENIPIALVPGRQLDLELELFVLWPVRQRLGLAPGEKITRRAIRAANLVPIYILQNAEPVGRSITASIIKSRLFYQHDSEMHALFQTGVCKIIGTQQHSVGLHFYEIGPEAVDALAEVRRGSGILITMGDHCAMMTDIVDLERFHVGKVEHVLAAKIFGIPEGSAYVQWVPAGLRFTLAYPTPVQTGSDLSRELKSERFRKLVHKMGEREVLNVLKRDAEERGTPVRMVLKKLNNELPGNSEVRSSAINGLYDDGLPWSGVLAQVNLRRAQKRWHFSVVASKSRPKTVIQFVHEFQQETGHTVRVAWNGGYILNPELVGKLGIPEKFIGSPLGLIISDGKVLAPPLFNKPAFLVLPDGNLRIRRVNCSGGLVVSDGRHTITFPAEAYNPLRPVAGPCFFDLLYPEEHLPGNGRVLVRLAGNRIKDIIPTQDAEKVPVLPVGLTLSLAADQLPASWQPEQELQITMPGWEEIESAIEAGPQLLRDGEVCIDMAQEGWKTQNSIRTQAARLDFTDMRGPKIAIGIDREGNLLIVTINGRIRESVGATHHDMAEILKAQGAVNAMGFDPGGSATLVVDGQTLNISPYNHDYERDVYALPPEPRAVSNAVLVW